MFSNLFYNKYIHFDIMMNYSSEKKNIKKIINTKININYINLLSQI